jgi:CheY-like chemotaxis protein/HPt (histidine-containing phosphotransfer) domain-containing protein
MDAIPVEGDARVEDARVAVARAAEETGAKTGGKAGGNAGRRLWRAHVLVAEDNQINQKVAVKMLERLGYRADVAADGREAIEALSSIPYAAVLMDVQMPEMGGYEATAEIRRREEDCGSSGRRTPIIAMTANAMQGDREQALGAGMDGYVPKPVKLEELEAALERWIPQGHEDGSSARGMPIAEGAPSLAPFTGHSEAEDTPLLDDGVLENLFDLGGTEMLSELSEMFFESVSSALTKLRKAVEEGDAPTVRRVAHTLKGGSGNMGAKDMSRICAGLEDAGASGDLSQAPELVGQLEEEFGRVRPALEAATRIGN